MWVTINLMKAGKDIGVFSAEVPALPRVGDRLFLKNIKKSIRKFDEVIVNEVIFNLVDGEVGLKTDIHLVCSQYKVQIQGE